MSGSFWKFGQDYANEAPLAKLLNKAFFKVNSSNTNIREENEDAVDKMEEDTDGSEDQDKEVLSLIHI